MLLSLSDQNDLFVCLLVIFVQFSVQNMFDQSYVKYITVFAYPKLLIIR